MTDLQNLPAENDQRMTISENDIDVSRSAPLVYIAGPPSPRNRGVEMAVYVIGVLQFMFGCSALCAVSYYNLEYYLEYDMYIGHPLITARSNNVLLAVSGVFSVLAAKRNNQSKLVTLGAAVFSIFVFIQACIFLDFFHRVCTGDFRDESAPCGRVEYNAMIANGAINVLFCIAGVIILMCLFRSRSP
eukprot:m.80093 g.80093  ORF g.80093 m.80093 type:complete len:188 (+) comp36163_c1_seq3:46-609(+)